MKSRTVMAVVLGSAFLLQSCLLSAKEQPKTSGPEKHYRLEWGDLAGMIADQKVSMVLPDAAHLQGRVLGVEPEALVLDITKTSDRRAHPKGHASIPRASVSVLRLTKPGGHVWQIVGGTLGTVGGLVLGVFVAAYGLSNSAGEAAVGAVILGSAAIGGAAGWWGGRVSDRRVIVITVVPESPQGAKPAGAGVSENRGEQ
jgi:hypothetical protein